MLSWKQSESSLKSSEGSQVQKSSDVQSLDLGPSAVKGPKVDSLFLFSSHKNPVERNRKKCVSWQPGTSCSIHKARHKQVTFKFTLQDNWFFSVRFTFSLISQICPDTILVISSIILKQKREKNTGRKGNWFTLFQSLLLQCLLLCCRVGQNLPLGQIQALKWQVTALYTWPDHAPFHSKMQSKPWKSYQC